MTTLQSTLRMSLIDDVSAKARVIGGALSGISKSTGAMTAPLRGISGQILAIGGAYLSVTEGVGGSFKAAASAQEALTEIGIKADLTGTQLEQLGQKMRSLAPVVNQSATDLTAGVDAMISMGTAASDAAGAIPAIGKAATATRATIQDLSSASSSAMQNLGVLPAEISKMLDGMASAGNAGAFELRDMAQYFPQLTASARSLGMNGVSGVNDMAAALQIARRGAGDASTAANNLSDFMGKIVTPQTIKNFKKFGVDVTKELEKANKNGISPIEHFITLLDKKTQGGKGELLTQIFGDKQTLDFVRPMIADFKDYVRIRDEANKASGTVDAAFQRRMQDANQKMKSFWISMENMGVAIGSRLIGPIGNAADEVANIFNTLDKRFTVFDQISYSMQGFWSGLSGSGEGGLGKLAKEWKDFFVGVENGGSAADKASLVFGQFRRYGEDMKFLTDAIANNKVLSFITELGLTVAGLGLSKWFRLFAIAAGIKAVVDAAHGAESIGQFASNLGNLSAMEWGGIAAGLLLVASRAKAVVSIFKKVQEVAPKGMGAGGKTGTTAATVAETTVKAGTRGSALPGPWNRIGPMSRPAGWQAPTMPRVNATGPKITSPNVAPLPSGPPAVSTLGLAGLGVATTLGVGSVQKMTPDQEDYFRSRMGGSLTVDALREANAPQGVQEVHVTNQQPPPPITIHAPITITGVSDPVAAANSAAKQIGDSVRAAREGAYTD